MRRVFIVGAVLALTGMPGLASAIDDIDGKVLYKKNCATCHGINGEPTYKGENLKPFPARNHRAIAKYVDRDEMRRLITYGIKDTGMNPKKYLLDPLQIEAVIDYIKTFDYKPDIANGKKRYEAVCSSCHGMDGRARTGPGAINLVYSKLDLKGIIYTMRHGRRGTMMKSNREQLSNTEIADVASYAYSLHYRANPDIGKKLYANHCTSCHATPSDIKLIGNAASSKRSIADLDDRMLDLRIRYGRHVARAGKKITHLNFDAIHDIMSYLRQEVN